MESQVLEISTHHMGKETLLCEGWACHLEDAVLAAAGEVVED